MGGGVGEKEGGEGLQGRGEGESLGGGRQEGGVGMGS